MTMQINVGHTEMFSTPAWDVKIRKEAAFTWRVKMTNRDDPSLVASFTSVSLDNARACAKQMAETAAITGVVEDVEEWRTRPVGPWPDEWDDAIRLSGGDPGEMARDIGSSRMGVRSFPGEHRYSNDNVRAKFRTGSEAIEAFASRARIVGLMVELPFDPTHNTAFHNMRSWAVRLFRPSGWRMRGGSAVYDVQTMETMFYTGRGLDYRSTHGANVPCPPTPGCVLESLVEDIRSVMSYAGDPIPYRGWAEDMGIDAYTAADRWEDIVAATDTTRRFLGKLTDAAISAIEEDEYV